MKMKLMLIFMVAAFAFMVCDTVSVLSMSIHEEMESNSNIAEREIIVPTEVVQMQATAYCLNGTTATGTQTRIGVAASKPEWFGRKVAVYRKGKDGYPAEKIGEYTIEDTGGKPIRNGSVIDLWFPTYDECIQFGRKNVFVYFLD